jgi:hypothetical protein
MIELNDLFSQYLQRQIAAGWDGFLAQHAGEVVPFEAAPVQPVEARLAWSEALSVLEFFGDHQAAKSVAMPAEWPTLVAQQDPVMALAFCAGNFPQSVRNLHALLQAAELTSLRPGAQRPPSAPAVLHWAEQQTKKGAFPQTLVVLGVLRLAKQFGPAEDMTKAFSPKVPAEWQAAWSNEQAALAWHDGRCDEAIRLWHAQEESVPVLFNRGMAALFSDQLPEARADLNRAVDQLGEDNSWHHLGKLYLALAEMHRR